MGTLLSGGCVIATFSRKLLANQKTRIIIANV
jgi:hypothetical protein